MPTYLPTTSPLRLLVASSTACRTTIWTSPSPSPLRHVIFHTVRHLRRSTERAESFIILIPRLSERRAGGSGGGRSRPTESVRGRLVEGSCRRLSFSLWMWSNLSRGLVNLRLAGLRVANPSRGGLRAGRRCLGELWGLLLLLWRWGWGLGF